MPKKPSTKKTTPRPLNSYYPIFLFLTKFFLLYGILYAFLLTFHAEPLQYAIATLESNWTSLPQQGLFILLGDGNSFFISEQCTGLVSAITLIALIWAGKKPDWKKKISLSVVGLFLLVIINLLRVYLVIHVGQVWGIRTAETAHQISWYLMTAIIIVFWHQSLTKWGKMKSIQEVAQ